jgi:glycerol-3-phosphate acyltransferase PlsY
VILDEIWLIIFISLISYLLGSIPSSVWLGQSIHGIDVRDYGSGNAGATNTFRVLGKEVGIMVLALDVLKGLTAASLIIFIESIPHGTERYVNLQLLFGLLAVVGHIFPIFANFRGGKGIATLLGMVVGIQDRKSVV